MLTSMTRQRPLAHFIGIAGIGVSSLAQWFLAHGWAVSGWDRLQTPLVRRLKQKGIRVKIGTPGAPLPRGAGLVVYGQTFISNNPQLTRARAKGIPSFSYPEAVGKLTDAYSTIAVAGSHGKSTTTSIIATMLARAGLDPTVIVGTTLKEFGGLNFRSGKGPYLVLEADEYKRAFLRYSPTLAVVTNIDREHLDVYRNLCAVQRAFLKFLSRVRPNGAVVLNRDDHNLFSLRSSVRKLAAARHIRVAWYSLRDSGARRIRKYIRIPGEYNISNALAAFHIGRMLGVPEAKILGAIRAYRGSERRLEFRGTYQGAPVFDDYAHHPTEIRVTLCALKEKFPRKKIVCVFQPHQAERLYRLFREFRSAFDPADETLILPVYKPPGRREEKMRITSEDLTKAIQKQQPSKPLFYLAHPENLKKALGALGALHAKVVVMMGAGDIVHYTDSLIR
ncbi:MAG: UDP-N-acetylmuramate-L-alanine ligase [Parcubacteria group bacterium GW2011_GWB1_56_8]|nr:MAG: UDP-N-acetylmuramate-L-alanine ligase [Parcubacteria group bacterium GW2011_GWB1_56_8]